MAQKVQTLFIDDIDGGEAEGTDRFGLDGEDYEIDLSAAHSKALRKAAAKYIAAGRKVRCPARRGRGGTGICGAGAAGGAFPSRVRRPGTWPVPPGHIARHAHRRRGLSSGSPARPGAR